MERLEFTGMSHKRRTVAWVGMVVCGLVLIVLHVSIGLLFGFALFGALFIGLGAVFVVIGAACLATKRWLRVFVISDGGINYVRGLQVISLPWKDVTLVSSDVRRLGGMDWKCVRITFGDGDSLVLDEREFVSETLEQLFRGLAKVRVIHPRIQMDDGLWWA